AQPDEKFLEFALVFVKGEIIPREIWARYKPKAGILVEVRAFPIPRGGGGDGEKNPLRIVLTIAVMAFAIWAGPIVAGWFFGMGPLTAGAAMALNVASSVATAAIGYGGMLAVNAIAPVRFPKMDQLTTTPGQSTDSPSLFIQGARNGLRPFSPVPVVLGKYRNTPALGAKPFTEIIGDKQFVRMLFVWGVGPLAIDTTSLKIGETLLSEFTGIQTEHKEGYDSDTSLSLFPQTVNQEDFSVLLTQAASWITRTSDVNADELSIDISFPQGLVFYDNNGNRQALSVNIEIEYKDVLVSGWTKIDTSNAAFKTTAPDGWLNKSGDDLDSITFTQNRTSEIRHGIRWGVAVRSQYDIRIRRVTADSTSSQRYDASLLTVLRTFTNEDPINSPVPVAKTVLVIQSTDQLNGIVDEFSGIVTSVVPDWDTGSQTWIERETQNPASLFRSVLQGKGITEPVADNRIDLETLQYWHEFCDAKGLKFNMIRDFTASVWDTLYDVASAGRAAPTQFDGKWSVVIEEEKVNPVSQITPRNSYDFHAEKFFVNAPHAWRIRFPNEDEGYRMDERRVYKDGFSESNATLFESLELPGVTDPDQAYKLGRFRIAQGINQPERWMWKQDMEFLTYRRGDRVLITHDVLLVGLYSGRIKTLVLSGADVTGLVLDEEVTMEAGTDYGITIRALGGQYTRQVVTVAETTKIITLTTLIAGEGSPAVPAIDEGDIFGFGVLGQESDDASIISIRPENNLRAQIIAVPYRVGIFDVDSESIPTFETNLTPLLAIPAPNIREVLSDESAIAFGAGETLRVRIGVGFDPLNAEAFGNEQELRVQLRPSATNEPFFNATIESIENNHVFIAGVRTGETFDIRIRFIVPTRLPGPWAYVYGHQVVGKSTPPDPLSNMTISAFGAQALIRWDRPGELDVLFGGEVVFRHSPSFSAPTWSETVTIGQAARAKTLYAVLPLKPGSYLARVYDVAGNPSDEITVVTTKQASVLQFASVDSLDEATAFLGDKDGVIVDSGNLTLDDTISPRELTGRYDFSQGIDLGSEQRVRVTTRLAVSIFNVGDNIDDRTENIDDWEDFDGALAAGADARVFIRHTDDDPAGSPISWSDWERIDSAEFEARAFEFYAQLTRDSLDYNILVSELGIDIEDVV
ncbi:hypothetical protein KAR91_47365, partial [Candidatus Pacearchaeota archaeon]|nr:hypothetical protein [Candidatus Pacearchaeota archaeon]